MEVKYQYLFVAGMIMVSYYQKCTTDITFFSFFLEGEKAQNSIPRAKISIPKQQCQFLEGYPKGRPNKELEKLKRN
jgi:hypothetical protein